ncbi:MAG: cation:proton antiporter, partial [Muribaculaceae bacterium]|nr:cation:proton antiporter [Muribaculaceae bacterium]
IRNTHKMIIMSRCYIPVDTIYKLVVFAPDKAEYETGFQTWVERIGNLSSQLACKVIFMSSETTNEFIRNILEYEKFSIRQEYRTVPGWDDFIVESREIGEEDLFIIIGARKDSISYTGEFENMPSFLSRNFARHNMVMIYPAQFGEES